jgi:hypothetical protein
VQPPFQADIKGLASYPLPWWGLIASATLQNRSGPMITARYTVTSAQTQNLGRPLGLGTAATYLIAPNSLYGDRVTQVDARFGKSFKLPRGRIQASIDIFNVLNSSAIWRSTRARLGAAGSRRTRGRSLARPAIGSGAFP